MCLSKRISKALLPMSALCLAMNLVNTQAVAQENTGYRPKVVNFTTTNPAPSVNYGYNETARALPQVIMAGVSPSVIDVNDTSFEILALVRPGKVGVQSVTAGQGGNPFFNQPLKHINTLKNGDQVWKVIFQFDKGTFGNNVFPIKWGTGANQFFLKVTDINQQTENNYQFPQLKFANSPAQAAAVDTVFDDKLSYLSTKRAVPQVIMAGTSPAVVDLLDSSFDIVAIIRPGVVPLQSVLVKQGDNNLFSVAMEKKKELSNGDQIWVFKYAFPQGSFGTTTIPVVWGTAKDEFSIQVIDIAQQVSTAYPVLRSGTFPVQQ